MGEVGQWFSDQWEKLTGKTPQQVVDPISKQLPSGTDLGMAAERGGYTSAGGRRHKRLKKTRKGKKSIRKTRRH